MLYYKTVNRYDCCTTKGMIVSKNETIIIIIQLCSWWPSSLAVLVNARSYNVAMANAVYKQCNSTFHRQEVNERRIAFRLEHVQKCADTEPAFIHIL